jgi:phosphoserine phosphatase
MFTGEPAGPFNAGMHKVQRIKTQIGSTQIAYAYGDTVNDLAMLEASQNPIAVYPDSSLRKVAQDRNWRILE